MTSQSNTIGTHETKMGEALQITYDPATNSVEINGDPVSRAMELEDAGGVQVYRRASDNKLFHVPAADLASIM